MVEIASPSRRNPQRLAIDYSAALHNAPSASSIADVNESMLSWRN
jgi:hypothetical protein